MKLGMWVVMGTSTAHVVFRHQMRIFNTSFGNKSVIPYTHSLTLTLTLTLTLIPNSNP